MYQLAYPGWLCRQWSRCRLHGMPKLAMTAPSAYELPAVVFEHPDDFADLHGAERTTRLEQPKVIDTFGIL